MSAYLTTDELSARIKYSSRYIREHLKDKVLKKGIHYIKPFGSRKILYIWDEIQKIMVMPVNDESPIKEIILRRVK